VERQRGQESDLPMLWSSDWMERMVREGSWPPSWPQSLSLFLCFVMELVVAMMVKIGGLGDIFV